MSSDKTLSSTELRDYLNSLIVHGVKLGLHNIQQLMVLEGNPQNAYPVAHVAGTNGKGSVLTFLNAILRKAGYRTGRFTSPHLIEVNERFLIDDVPISTDELYEHLDALKRTAEKASISPTYFEMNTAVAFRCFARHNVDIALLEVGMGGRFDSTNIVEPLVCAITNISHDHTQYLGETLEQIAFEKAGILKKNVPAVTGAVSVGPMSIIEAQARRVNAPLYHLDEEYRVVPGGTTFEPTLSFQGQGFDIEDAPLGLSGEHQVYNAAVAIELAGLLRNRFTAVTQSVVCDGLKIARWPGRLERVLDTPPVIMDVAHNPAGCFALAEALPHCVTIFSVSSDKDASQMLEILSSISDPLILTEYAGGRSLPAAQLGMLAGKYPHQLCPTLSEAIDAGMKLAGPHKPLLITGSIYAAGEARRLMIEHYGARPVVF